MFILPASASNSKPPEWIAAFTSKASTSSNYATSQEISTSNSKNSPESVAKVRPSPSNDDFALPSSKRKKLSKTNEADQAQSDWKQSIVNLENKRFEAEDKKRSLECYNLALQNIGLERRLGNKQ